MKKTRGTIEDTQAASRSVGAVAVERLFSGVGLNCCSLQTRKLEQVMWAHEWVKHAY